ncbi:MAG: (d)CMP kinase [Bacteroidota bacterium]|nr:(d)CMP kinase [Bacteroidota bacterium]
MKNTNSKLIIAIDGYSSCGKSTFAKQIAKTLGYIYIDSGAMYRAVTLYCLENNLINDGEILMSKLLGKLDKIEIGFRFNQDSQLFETILNGENVEEKIRTVYVSNYVSPVSKIKEVREKMVKIQRNLGKDKGIVMDGRDIGTVVFPNADLKIFMTASPAIRAQRRYDESVDKGQDVSFREIEKNILTRDRIDEGREISPLKRAHDALLLDNSHLNVKEQMEWVMKIIEDTPEK